MAIKITLKNSVVQDSVPTTSHLAAVGELALNANINSLGIYMRASDNSIVKMAGPGSVTTPAASVTVAGIAELATSAETTTGTDTARVTTPAGVKAVTDAERTTSNNTYLAKAGGTLTGVLAATAGSNSAPAINFGDADSGIYGGTNTVSLAAAGVQGLTLNSSAYVNVPTRLGVGVASPTHLIHIADAGTCGIAIEDTGHGFASSTIIVQNGGRDLKITPPQDLIFENGTGETVRVDSGGRVLVGHSSKVTVGSTNLAGLQSYGTTGAAGINLARFSANTEAPVLNFGKARGASIGTMTIVNDGDDLGEINFNGADGVNLGTISSRIRGAVDGTPAADDIPGRIEFYTFKASNNTLTEALRITNDGIVRVPDNGKFTAGASDDLAIYHDGSNSYINESGTGHLKIRSDDAIKFQKTNGSWIAIFNADAATELYYDNSKKLETLTNGAKVSGNLYVEDAGTHFKSNQISFQPAGTAYIDHTTVDQDIVFRTSDASALDTTALTIDASDAGTAIFNHDVKVADNGKFIAGAGSDIQLYHDGSDSYLKENGTGNLKILGNSIELKTSGDGEHYAKFTLNGAVELYNDNSKVLETTANGITVQGADGASGILNLYADRGDQDADKWRFQATNVNTGGEIKLSNYASGAWEDNIIANSDGNLQLYFDNSKKFATASDGITVYGKISADELDMGDDEKILLGTSDDLQLYHDGSHSFIKDAGTGSLILNGTDIEIKNANNDETMATFTRDGAVDLYYDNVKAFETSNDGVRVLGPESADARLSMYADEGDDNADKWQLVSKHTPAGFLLRNQKSGAWEWNFAAYGGASTDLYYDNTKRLETTSTGITVTGLSSSFLTSGAPVFEIRTTATSSVDAKLRICGARTTSTTSDISHIDFCTADDAGGFNYTQPMGMFSCRKASASTNKGRFYWVLNTSTGAGMNTRMDLQNDGDLNIDGTLSENSDVSLKKNVVTIANALSKVKQLRGVEFDRIETDRHEVGCIAQEVQSVIPEVVKQRDEDNPLLTLSYNRLTAVLIEAVKELADKVAALEGA